MKSRVCTRSEPLAMIDRFDSCHCSIGLGGRRRCSRITSDVLSRWPEGQHQADPSEDFRKLWSEDDSGMRHDELGYPLEPV